MRIETCEEGMSEVVDLEKEEWRKSDFFQSEFGEGREGIISWASRVGKGQRWPTLARNEGNV